MKQARSIVISILLGAGGCTYTYASTAQGKAPEYTVAAEQPAASATVTAAPSTVTVTEQAPAPAAATATVTGAEGTVTVTEAAVPPGPSSAIITDAEGNQVIVGTTPGSAEAVIVAQ